MGMYEANFQQRKLDAAMSAAFVRASGAYDVDTDGEMSLVGNNVPAFDRVFTPAREQLLVNTVWSGAVSGTPGTPATSWDSSNTGGITTVVPSRLGVGNAIRVTTTAARQNQRRIGISVTTGAHVWSLELTVHTSGPQLYQFFDARASTATISALTWRVDGASVAATYVPTAGLHVVECLFTVTVAGTVYVQFGGGIQSNGTCDATFDLPQFETGTARTEHMPNSSTVQSLVVLGGPVSGESALPLGGSRTNSYLQSDDVPTTWFIGQMLPFGSGSVSNGGIAPDGKMTADLLVPTTASTAHQIRQSVAHTSGTSRTVSFFVKPAGYRVLGFRENTATGAGVVVNLETGAVLYNNGSVVLVRVRHLANGWKRLSITWIVYTTSTQELGLYVMDDNYPGAVLPHSYAWAGDGVSGMYFWRGVNEAGTFVSPAIATTTIPVARAMSYIGPVLLSNMGLASQALEFSGAALLQTTYPTYASVTASWEPVMCMGAEGSVTYVLLRYNMVTGSFLLTRYDNNVQVAEIEIPSGVGRGWLEDTLVFVRWSWGAAYGMIVTVTIGNRATVSATLATAPAKAAAYEPLTKFGLGTRIQSGIALGPSQGSFKYLASKVWDTALSQTSLVDLRADYLGFLPNETLYERPIAARLARPLTGSLTRRMSI